MFKSILNSFLLLMRTKKNKLCSPQMEDSFTCFTKKALIKIIKAWNKSNKDNKIIYNYEMSKKKLWASVNDKLKGNCNNDYCWTNQKFMGKLSRKFKKKYFRPKMPNEWNKNSREWLSTVDIENVLNQYEKKYKNFLFIGAVPMDFDKSLGPGMCVIDELCNINIKRLINKGKTKIGIVFNLDNHDQDGSHWVSFFCDFDRNAIYYFDSYGYNETKEIRSLIKKLQEQGKKLNRDIKYFINKKRHQYKESECGIYSINFIERLLNNEDFEDISLNVIKDDDMFLNRERYFINVDNL